MSIPEDVIALMPESVARENLCLPLAKSGETLLVAHYREDIPTQDKLRFLLNCNVQFYVRPRHEIMEAIDHYYGSDQGESADSLLHDMSVSPISQSDVSEVESVRGRVMKLRVPTGSRTSSRSLQRKSSLGSQGAFANVVSINQGKEGMFFYTVREGQKALAYRKGGQIDVIEGPKRIWNWGTTILPMAHFVAHPGEYLAVRFQNGTQENIKGPTQIWFDPRVHDEIKVEAGLSLSAKEAVVVYGEDDQEVTQRRIVYGPGQFVPQPGEWLHQFSWHASKGGSKGVEKKPNGMRFSKLWLMPDQMYHDVRDVRTADDAVLVIRLMIFFELLDIEKMLDTTHDPIGDFINAATSDVVEFTGKRTFEVFKQQTEQLNELSTYAQLLHRAEQCGYRINNVVYRGYGAPDSLQKMHDEAIAARTSLQLNRETEKQTQELEDYRLQCQLERSQRRRAEQTSEVEHDIELQQKREQAKLDVQEKQLEFQREQKRRDAELEADVQRQSDDQARAHLDQLRGLGVELTEYLTQGRADQVIEFRGRNGKMPHVHINQNGFEKKKPK